MRGLVFGITYDRALAQLKVIQEGYEKIRVKTNIFVGETTATLTCSNGDRWQTVYVPNGRELYCCGSRANIAYIDKLIPKSVIEYNIKCVLNLPPYTGIQYYDVDLWNIN